MKRVFLIALLLSGFVLTGIAQTGIYTGVVGKPEFRKTGLVIRPEIGYDYDMSNGSDFFHFATNVGYQISPCIFVGVGTGLYAGVGLFVPIYSSFRWYWFRRPSSPFLDLDIGVCYGRYRNYNYYDYYSGYYDGFQNGYQNGYHDGYYDDYYDPYYDHYYDPYDYPYYHEHYGQYVDYCEWMAYGRLSIGYGIKNFDIKLGMPVLFGSQLFAGFNFSLGYNFMPKK